MKHKLQRWPLILLGALYALALAAEGLAPYDPGQQNRSYPNAPPTLPRFVDAEGQFHWRPFVYALEPVAGSYDEYAVDTTRRFPLQFARPATESLARSEPVAWRRVGVEAPGRLFLLGTDRYGRDLFSRLLHGARISLLAGLLAGALAVAIGLLLGALAGTFGGGVDTLVTRLVELVLCLPALYLLMAVRAFLPLEIPPQQAFLLISVLIALLGWGRTARLVRGRALAIRRRGFVVASAGFGATRWQILRRHIVPHTLPVALTQGALLVPQFVLAEVGLSFFGLGMGEPMPSLGTLLVDMPLETLVDQWWRAAPAGLLLVIVLSYHGVASYLERRLRSASA